VYLILVKATTRLVILSREQPKEIPTGAKFGCEYLSTVFFLSSGVVCARDGFGSDSVVALPAG